MIRTTLGWLMWIGIVLCLGSCAIYKDPITIGSIDINTGIKAGHDLDIKVENPSSPSLTSNQAEMAKKLRQALGVEADLPEQPASAPVSKSPPIELCSRFVPPKLGELPKLNAKEINDIAKAPSDKQFEQMLAAMAKMYQYSRDARDAYNAKIQAHNKTCRMVSIQQ